MLLFLLRICELNDSITKLICVTKMEQLTNALTTIFNTHLVIMHDLQMLDKAKDDLVAETQMIMTKARKLAMSEVLENYIASLSTIKTILNFEAKRK